ncbi:hypothetical protein B0H16DRAFT_1556533 [Mycena metata]|uniref:F-box domain-containing protein n=1 Tax=Mycena metata TaxID=1033252 RepID=A0AAD7IPN0_9AGAR|nr:hypothetical protein B0H16DRAFT_1556533 [Mycena metata]
MDSCPFPLEVLGLIVDQLDDFLTLKSCSYVCKSLLPSCRAHLFRDLQLRPAGRTSPESWNHFLTRAPHLLPYIQQLIVLCERSSWVSWDPVLPTLLAKLQNIGEIELHGCDLPCLPTPLSAAIYALFHSPSMKHVRLRLCVLPSSCFDLFGPALESIVLSDVAVEPELMVHALEASHPARPKHLMIEGKAVGPVVDWLIPSSERNELEDLQSLSLKYQGDDPEALRAVERLLQHAGSLQTLHIGLYPAGHQSMPELCPAPCICYNQQLRELRLSHFDMDISSPTNQLPWLGSLLSQMTTQYRVQKITVDARHRPCLQLPILDQTGWTDVDGILARNAPSCLEDVHIRIGDAYNASPGEVSSCMPMLSAKGILRVTL